MAGHKTSNSILIGIVAIAPYIANYFLRNMLGVFTPFILKATEYSKEYLALLSSIYMIAYAAGQLFNGVLGDFVKPKIMVFSGLVSAGLVTMLFPFAGNSALRFGCFAVLGYGLSMLRGPLMKVISENMKPSHARVTCVFFSFSSFAGPMIAGLFSLFLGWKAAFVSAGVLAALTAIAAFAVLALLEKNKIIAFQKTESFGIREMFGVFKIKGFAFYIVIACLVEIAATSISFWIPTFLNEYIRFGESESSMVFSFISLMRALVPFMALWVYKICGERDTVIMYVAYAAAFLAFAAMLFIYPGIMTVVLLLIALMLNSLVSALLWSIYIPSLGKTGKVSGANGILDCTGYIAASAATTLFAHTVGAFGWKGLTAAWGVIPLIGLGAVYINCRREKN